MNLLDVIMIKDESSFYKVKINKDIILKNFHLKYNFIIKKNSEQFYFYMYRY